jgi:hypothetical protein
MNDGRKEAFHRLAPQDTRQKTAHDLRKEPGSSASGQHLLLRAQFEPVVWHSDIKVWVHASEHTGAFLSILSIVCIIKTENVYNTLTMEATASFLSVFRDFINATGLDSNLLWREINRDGDNHTPDIRNCTWSQTLLFLFFEIFTASKREWDKSHR